MRYLPVLCFVLLMLPTIVQAHTTTTINYTCPVDGVEFSHFTTGSDYVRGSKLDLQPIGMGSYPWPAAQCPNDGMIMFKNSFTPEEVAILKDYVGTPEYQQMVKEDTTYWRAAKLKEKLGVPLNERWFTMLQATWQTYGDQYDSYASETIKAVEALLADPPKDKKEKDIETWRLLSGELYRRVGDFDKAKTIFEELITQPTFKNHDFYPQLIGYQLELIAKKDKASHAISDIEKKPE